MGLRPRQLYAKRSAWQALPLTPALRPVAARIGPSAPFFAALTPPAVYNVLYCPILAPAPGSDY